MKITVFGASGKTGHEVVKKALSEGHNVTAYVRRESSMNLEDSKLKIVVGNLNEVDKISETIKGSDACISTLGGSSLKKTSEEVVNGIGLIVSQMESQNVERFIYLSSLGAGESRYNMGRFMRFLVLDNLLKIPIADHNRNEQCIQSSTLKWTLVRPGGLTDGPEGGEIKSGSEKTIFKGNPKITRANVAAFMIDQLSAENYLNKAVWLK